jgi:hypothetical protein
MACRAQKVSLDKIELIAKRKLQGYGKQFNFQNDASIGSLGIVNYTLNAEKSIKFGISQTFIM